jgi:hypothetical protein
MQLGMGYMRQVKLLGLCVCTALASGALAASGAGAGSFNTCVRVGKGGNFTESSCATVAKKKGQPSHKGKYELEPVGACVAMRKGAFSGPTCEVERHKRGGAGYGRVPTVSFTGTTDITKITLGSISEGYIECAGGTSSGTIISAKDATERLTFSGCKEEHLGCQSVGSSGTPSGASEEIETNELAVRLLGHGEQTTGPSHEEPAVGEAWLEYSSAEHQPYVMEIECGASVVLLRISGSFTGHTTPTGVLTSSVSTLFEQPVIEEALQTEAYDGVGFEGAVTSNLEGDLTEQYDAPVEIEL